MKRRHPEVYIGAGLLAFCAVGFFVIIPREIDELVQFGATAGMSPRVFPQVAIIALAVLSIVLIATRLRTAPPAPEAGSDAVAPAGRVRAAGVYAIMVLYAVLIETLGYFVVTPVTIIAVGALFGERRWLLLIGLAVVTTALVWLFFRYGLYLVLPEGTVFTHGLLAS